MSNECPNVNPYCYITMAGNTLSANAVSSLQISEVVIGRGGAIDGSVISRATVLYRSIR